jgi:hypothetical protein
LVAKLIELFGRLDADDTLRAGKSAAFAGADKPSGAPP